MCGIFAVFNSNHNAPKNLEGFFSDSMIASGVRGLDSTGVFSIYGPDRNILHHKLPVNGSMFVTDKATKAIIDDVDVKRITVGHVRKATSGAVNINNAHPFITKEDANGDYIIGVHNGGMAAGWKSRINAYKYDVDSQWMFAHILEKGLAAFEDFEGAYALVWYDTRTPDVINVARNKERPLYYQYLINEYTQGTASKRNGTVVDSSEHGMLTWLTNRNNIPVEDKVFIFEEGYHYTFNIDDVTKYTKTKLPEKKVVATTTTTTTTTQLTNRGTYVSDKDVLMNKMKLALKGKSKSSNIPKPPADGFNSNASLDERTEALRQGELGRKFLFDPLEYDEVHNELFGSIEWVFPAGHPNAGKIVVIDAVLRGISKQVCIEIASGKYELIEASVCGIYKDSRGNETYVLHQPIMRYPGSNINVTPKAALN